MPLESTIRDQFRIVFWVAVVPAFMSVALLIFAVREPARAAAPPARMPLHWRELARLGRPFWLLILLATVFTLARFREAFLLLRAQQEGWPPCTDTAGAGGDERGVRGCGLSRGRRQ